MIGVDFTGRLGNQLFTYAFLRNVWERQGRRCCIKANFKRCRTGNFEEGFDNSIRFFHTVPVQEESSDLILTHGTWKQRAIYLYYTACSKLPWIARNDRLMTRIEQKIEQYGLYFTGAADKARFPDTLPSGPLFIRGYFQDKNNFENIRPILLEELTPTTPPLPSNKNLYEIAARPDSVCVSVRCGDYLSSQYKSDFYVCTPRYFQKAIALIRERTDNPTFIFFSNDIAWVKNNIRVPEDVECYYESGTDPAWETLRLMYSCHHFIISNSTFAWWAQYLGRRSGKIVVSPTHWFANPNWSSNLIDDSFLQVSDG